ncbi:MAG: hypothetical protein GX575_07980 [Candidatus Anammoximicrobium sp.]|nr:hypothetical protein [Candidatus Anammoximicrobium sp.]
MISGLSGCWGVVLLAVLVGVSGSADAYTPDSPEVRQVVDKAVAWLEKNELKSPVGGQCLVGLALLKAGKAQSHPLIQSAIAAARKSAEQFAAKGAPGHCYNETIACIYLCDVDPMRYAPEINMFAQGMLKRQRPNGCWSYEPYTYDDTSQTQYGVLCLWAAHQAGVAIPARAIESVAHWLMRSQSTDGGWVYRAADNGSYERVSQGTSTHSMTAAGTGSLYVCAHLLGFGADAKRSGGKQEKSGLPPALQKVESEQGKGKRQMYLQPSGTNAQQLFGFAAAGDAWFARNLRFDVREYRLYYIYGLERYKSFQELVQGQVVPEPDWYNQGVEFLRKSQLADGTWEYEGSYGLGAAVDTAFAVLFLTRSSQKAIKKATLDEGVLIGGMGLPKDLTNARMQDGKVVTPQMVRDVDDLLELLSSTEDKEFDPTALPGGLSLDADLTKRTSQLERLRALVTNENFEARLAAVRTLAKSRDLDNVPALIYALSDPNWMVVEAARDGLCFISRKFQGYGPPPNATPEQKQAAQIKWKQWYLAIRPDGQLID